MRISSRPSGVLRPVLIVTQGMVATLNQYIGFTLSHPQQIFLQAHLGNQSPPLHSAFPQAGVSSDLAQKIERADHGQGAGSGGENLEKHPNSFVLNIFTSNPLGLKILQTLFAEPAPVKAFRGWRRRGYSSRSLTFPKRNSFEPRSLARDLDFFRSDIHSTRSLHSDG